MWFTRVVLAMAMHIMASAQGFLWSPLTEVQVTCDFCGYRNESGSCHGGLDLRARRPIPIYAAADGRVEYIEENLPDGTNRRLGYGNRVVLQHTNGYRTIYAHLSRNSVNVSVKDEVQAGQQIAISDNSGRSSAPHLHFEVRGPDGRQVDPYGDRADRTACYTAISPECGTNPLWATCPPRPWNPEFADNDGDSYCPHESICAPGLIPGDCMDSGETLEGVPASAVHPGAEEVCNYTDDNCDGTVDEGFEGVLEPCAFGVGACRREGIMSCTTDFAGITCSIGPGIPSPELCDGVDNDCDGEVDENFSEPLATESGHTPLGTPCSRGSEVCNNRSEGIFICSTDGATTRCDADILSVDPDCTGKCGLVCGVACFCPAGQTCGETCSASGCWGLCTTAGSACTDTCPIAASNRCSSRSGYYNRCAPSFDADPCLEWGGDVFCNSDPYYSFCCYTSPDLPLISSEPRCYCP